MGEPQSTIIHPHLIHCQSPWQLFLLLHFPNCSFCFSIQPLLHLYLLFVGLFKAQDGPDAVAGILLADWLLNSQHLRTWRRRRSPWQWTSFSYDWQDGPGVFMW